MFLSYRAFDFDSTMRRITAAKWCFTQLRSWLTSTVHPLATRLKLYRQCVMAIVSYGIHEMGITRRGLARLVSMVNTHHRIMTKSPVCLTHESTQNFLNGLISFRLGLSYNSNNTGSNTPCIAVPSDFEWKP